MSVSQSIVQPPEEVVHHRGRNALELRWGDGLVSRHTVLSLRAACACSSCTQARRRGQSLQVDAAVTLAEIRPMGGSGLQLVFSDGHQRGLFPWRYLRELAETASCLG